MRHHKQWRKAELTQLEALYRAGNTSRQMEVLLGRTVKAIQTKLSKEGIIGRRVIPDGVDVLVPEIVSVPVVPIVKEPDDAEPSSLDGMLQDIVTILDDHKQVIVERDELRLRVTELEAKLAVYQQTSDTWKGIAGRVKEQVNEIVRRA